MSPGLYVTYHTRTHTDIPFIKCEFVVLIIYKIDVRGILFFLGGGGGGGLHYGRTVAT